MTATEVAVAVSAVLQFQAVGIPAPQGSSRAFVVKGRAVLTSDNPRTRPWKNTLVDAALTGMVASGCSLTHRPVQVEVTFRMPRPKGHFRTGRNADRLRDTAPTCPAGKPDLDKLQRSLLDALTDAGVWRDDSQVVQVHAAKAYADGGPPGATVTVRVLP